MANRQQRIGGSHQSIDALSQLIALTAPKADARALATDMLAHYGSLAPILESHIDDLRAIPGITSGAAQLMSLLPQVARYVAISEFGEHPKLSTYAEAKRYLAAQYIGKCYEHCYQLCLDRTGKLIECVLVQQGTVDATPFYMRLLLEAAFRTKAYAIVLSHNHPSGTTVASPADILYTKQAISTFCHSNILVLDHIIICDDDALSMRECDDDISELISNQSSHALISGWYK